MTLGETLRKARMARKETASQVAAATRMKVQIVEGLEQGDFSQIPAPIYAKGFIRLYAEHVGVDPDPLIRDYLQNRDAQPVVAQNKGRKPSRSRESREPAQDLFMRAGIAVPGDTAPPEPDNQIKAEPQAKARHEPDKPTLDKNTRRNRGARHNEPPPPDTAVDPPITLIQQTLEKALLTLQHGFQRLRSLQGLLRDTLKDISVSDLRQTPGKLIAVATGLLFILVLLLSGLSRLVKGSPDQDPALPSSNPMLILTEDTPEPYFD